MQHPWKDGIRDKSQILCRHEIGATDASGSVGTFFKPYFSERSPSPKKGCVLPHCNIFQTCLEEYDENPYSEIERKNLIIRQLCPLLKFCINLLQVGANWIQFTVLSTINKVCFLT